MSANESIARLFEEYADILEAQGDDYRPRSYRDAAENIREYPEPVEELAGQGEDAVKEIEGVGDSLAAKVVEYVETDSIETIEEAKEDFPVDMAAITAVEGVGPRRAGDFYEELGVTTLDELETAAREGKIRELDGYGEKTEQNILEGIEFARQAQERRLLGVARPIGEEVRSHLADADAVEQVELAGSLRRWRETIGDVDVLAAGTDHQAIVERFLAWGGEEIESGESKASLRVSETPGGRLATETGSSPLRVDLRIVDPVEWGAALQYFTGSKDHNVRVRNRAIERDLKVNEYGVFDVADLDEDDGPRAGDRVAGETEASVYEALDLAWLPPELREDTGEVQAAGEGSLPALLDGDEIRGDLHAHTEWSDGNNTIEEMLDGAVDRGYDYVAITDHASGPGVVGGMGLDEEDILEQVDAIEAASDGRDVTALAGIEANVDADGELSVGEDALDALDIVIASPHSGLDGDGTDRLVTAMEHPAVDVLGHPSGRLINGRPGLDLDVDRLVEAAIETETALEVNANPHRLDLWDTAVRTAVDAGATIAINTDAHSPDEFDLLEFGVHTARRGWAEADDVLNTRDLDGLRTFLE